jgi:hypothetical protein
MADNVQPIYPFDEHHPSRGMNAAEIENRVSELIEQASLGVNAENVMQNPALVRAWEEIEVACWQRFKETDLKDDDARLRIRLTLLSIELLQGTLQAMMNGKTLAEGELAGLEERKKSFFGG